MAVAIKRECLIPLQSQSGAAQPMRTQTSLSSHRWGAAAKTSGRLFGNSAHSKLSMAANVCWKQPQLPAVG